MRVGVRVSAQSIDTACLLACLPVCLAPCEACCCAACCAASGHKLMHVVRHQDTRRVPLQVAHGWFAIHAALHGCVHNRLAVLAPCLHVERRM
jgi:hypothetical protein